jgi:cytochrome c peroxidase
VGVKQRFFHTGSMRSLAQVLAFLNTRDTEPTRWYPWVDGALRPFDDLPLRLQANLTRRAPFDGRAAGSTPAMSARDLVDIECFLLTLSDGHVQGSPPSPACRE